MCRPLFAEIIMGKLGLAVFTLPKHYTVQYVVVSVRTIRPNAWRQKTFLPATSEPAENFYGLVCSQLLLELYGFLFTR
jgi:hypothetical protein